MMAAPRSALEEVKRRRQLVWKYPCSVCCKPVKCNQKGLFCDMCNRWCPSACSYVSDSQYARLSALGPETPWFCHTCTLQQLPFSNSSFVSKTSSVSDAVFDEEDHPLLCNSTVVLCHINIRSLMPVFDELNNFLVNFQRPVVWELQSHGSAQQFLLMRFLFLDIQLIDLIVILEVVVSWFM